MNLLTRLTTVLLMASTAVAGDSLELTAWHMRHLEWKIFDSDLIVEGHLAADRAGIVIEHVHYDATRQRLGRTPLAAGTMFRVAIWVPEPAVALRSWEDPSSAGIPLSADNHGVWFIDESTDDAGVITYQVKETKWLVEGVAYSAQRPMNPGDRYLLPDNCGDLPTLRKRIADLLPRRRAFDAAINEQNPLTRLERLTTFLQPELIWSYFGRSTELLAAMGPAGVAVLQREAARPEQRERRTHLLAAMGRSKDVSAVPYLLQVAAESRPQFTQLAERFAREQASESQRYVMDDWQIAIYALAEIADERALTELRTAAIWGASHGDQQMVEYGVRGLGKIPCAENLLCFSAVFSALPRGLDGFDGFGVHPACYTLLALIEHKFIDALPILCSQLDHPDEYNRRQAHRGLVELVGSDLGIEPEPWLELFTRHQRQKLR